MAQRRTEVDKNFSQRLRSQFAKDNKEMDEVYDRKSSHGDFHFKGAQNNTAKSTQRHKRNMPFNKDSVTARAHIADQITVEDGDLFNATMRSPTIMMKPVDIDRFFSP